MSGMTEDFTVDRRRGRGRLAMLALAVALALLVPASFAQATYNPVASGQTRLSLDKAFTILLRQNGVKLSGKDGATLKAGKVTFPVFGGKFDPTTSNGLIEHAGALFFGAGHRQVRLTP